MDKHMALTASLTLVASPYRAKLTKLIPLWIKQSGFTWTADRCKSVVAYLAKLGAGESPARPAWVDPEYLKYPERLIKQGQMQKLLHVCQLWCFYTAFGDKQELSFAQVWKFQLALAMEPDVLRKEDSEANKALVNQFLKSEPHLLETLDKGHHQDEAKEIWGKPIYFKLPDGRSRLLSFARQKGFVSPYGNIYPKIWMNEQTGETIGPVVERFMPFDLFSTAPRRFTKVPNVWALRTHDSKGRITSFGKEAPGIYAAIESLKMFGPLPYSLSSIARPSWEIDRSEGARGYVDCRVQRNGKARFFFAPPTWAQHLLYPWAQSLYGWLKRIPQDYTHDQAAGAKRVQKWIADAKAAGIEPDVSSIDLSSATDRMPLAFTLWVLRNLQGRRKRPPNWSMWCLTFGFLSRLDPQARYGGDHTLRWIVGQPLGLVASFAAFAITNHYLARLALALADREINEDSYAIVGDDIVFRESYPAYFYRKLLSGLGVEVSEEKSLSGRLAEFVGRLITDTDIEFKLKFEPAPSLRLLRSRIDLLGPRALRSYKQSKLRDLIALFPTSRTPNGINPGGFSKEQVERFFLAYQFLEQESYGEGELGTRSKEDLTAMFGCESLWKERFLFEGEHYTQPQGTYSHRDILLGRKLPKSPGLVWKYSSYSSRAFLTRIKTAAKAAGIM